LLLKVDVLVLMIPEPLDKVSWAPAP